MKDECKSFKCTDLHIFRRVECSYYIHSLWKTKRTGYWTQVARSHTDISLDEETKGIKWKLLLVHKKRKRKNRAHYSTASSRDLFGGLGSETGYRSYGDRGTWSLRSKTNDLEDLLISPPSLFRDPSGQWNLMSCWDVGNRGMGRDKSHSLYHTDTKDLKTNGLILIPPSLSTILPTS